MLYDPQLSVVISEFQDLINNDQSTRSEIRLHGQIKVIQNEVKSQTCAMP